MKQNNHSSKRHGERKERTATKNLIWFSPLRIFCVATTQGIHLCIAVIATKHALVSTFSLGEKTEKRTPGCT